MTEHGNRHGVENLVKFAGLFGICVAGVYFVGWTFTRCYFTSLGLWSLLEAEIPATVLMGNAWWVAIVLVVVLGLYGGRTTCSPRFVRIGWLVCIVFGLLAGITEFHSPRVSLLFNFAFVVACAMTSGETALALIHESESKPLRLLGLILLALYMLPATLGLSYGKSRLYSPYGAFPTVRDAQGHEYVMPFAVGERLYVFEAEFPGKYPTYRVLNSTDDVTIRHH